MSSSSDSKSIASPDLPAFLRDPQPSKRLKCPTPLVAWLQSSIEASGATSDLSAQQDITPTSAPTISTSGETSSA